MFLIIIAVKGNTPYLVDYMIYKHISAADWCIGGVGTKTVYHSNIHKMYLLAIGLFISDLLII